MTMWVAALVVALLIQQGWGADHSLPSTSRFAQLHPWLKTSEELQHLVPHTHGWVTKGGMAVLRSWSLHGVHATAREDAFWVSGAYVFMAMGKYDCNCFLRCHASSHASSHARACLFSSF